MKKPILMLTRPSDAHAHRVQAKLSRYAVGVLYLDTNQFPTQSTLTAELSSSCPFQAFISEPAMDQRIDVHTLWSIWYRRPTPFVAPTHLSETTRTFITDEARMALGGVARSSPALWVNHPECTITANYKLVQLHQAREVGLTIPHTLVTNDPQAVRSFYDTCNGQVIYKPLWIGTLKHADGSAGAIYTSQVTREHLKQLDRVQLTAHQFQALVPRRCDLRVNIIGTHVLATEIRSHHPASPIDWRRSYQNVSYAPHQIPEIVRQHLLCLMDRFSLVFAAIDMIITPEGEYIFIEINPNGQWLWLEDAAHTPVSEAIAHLLATHE